MLIIVNERIFVDFLTRFDYNKLVDSNIEITNLEYWNGIKNLHIATGITIGRRDMENLLNPMNIFGIIFMKITANDGRALLLFLSFLCEGYI